MAKILFTGNQRTSPPFFADGAGREHLALFPAKADPTAFSDALAVVVTVGVAGAIQNATSIPVAALTTALAASTALISGQVLIPKGATIFFGGAKVATLTADAKIGDTALTVAAIPTAVVSGDVARYSPANRIFLPAGTLVGRTYAERDAGTAFGAPDLITPDDEIYLTAFDTEDLYTNADIELIRWTTRIKENYLPGYTALAAAVNEVQTVNFNIASTGGTVVLRVPRPNGSFALTTPIAWSATDATYLASIQAALDVATGVVNGIVASAIAATDTDLGFKLTFSGTGYAAKAQPAEMVSVETLPTSTTAANVQRTTAGGSAWLNTIRRLYACFKGQD